MQYLQITPLANQIHKPLQWTIEFYLFIYFDYRTLNKSGYIMLI